MSATGPVERKLDILVVDDIAASRRSLAELVEGCGHRVMVADSGSAALQSVIHSTPDVLLLDLLMPDMDGFEMTRRVRALTADRWVPVIVVSSLEGDEHFCQALRNGADDFLVRPVNPELLDAKLKHYGNMLELQRRLVVASQRQRDIYDNLRDAVITLDAVGRVRDLNLSACRAFGNGTPAGLLMASCEDVMGVSLESLLSQKEVVLMRPGGHEMPAELAVSEWFEDGHTRYTLVVRDLTERRQIDRMKDEFLATVSHELRTPLTSILGAIGLLSAGAAGAMPEPARHLASIASRNAERLGRMIDDLLDLTKLESNRLLLKNQPCSVGTLLAEAMVANQGYADRAQVQLSSEVSEADAQRLVRVDSDRFAQVMANLLSNAIKHSPAQSTVTVSLHTTERRIRITVRDRGPGLAPEFRARMFEKFSQADGSDRRAQGGTGLGLYITRLLVQRMGGRISADAVTGPGAQFTVDFPDAHQVETPPALQIMHIDRDADSLRRLANWLGSSLPVRGFSSIAEVPIANDDAAACIVIGDPVGQGSAEAFCADMRRLASRGISLLYSDSVDAEFAQRMGITWLRKSSATRDEIERSIRQAVVFAHRAEGS